MAEIPLILKLKKQAHKDLAIAQDVIVKELYKLFGRAILHGGTAIWRCYNGNRFSEDVDAYIPKNENKINLFFKTLERKGFTIKKKKIGERSMFSTLELNRTVVRFEALFKKPLPKGFLKEYATNDGNFISVYTLTPEELIEEKAAAYLNRQKIRDLYDVFFLLRYVKNRNYVRKYLKRVYSDFKKPVDESELKVLIIEGIVPGSEDMLAYLKRA